jgi:ribosomal protein L19E
MARGKKGDGPNKMQLVREAIAELGAKAKPLAIQQLIKEKHNHEIGTQMISSYKSMLNKPKGRGRKPGRPAASAAPAGTGGKGDWTDDVVTLRKLVDRLGATQLHKLIDVLS